MAVIHIAAKTTLGARESAGITMAEVAGLVVGIHKGNVQRNGCEHGFELCESKLAGRQTDCFILRSARVRGAFCILFGSGSFHLVQLIVCKLKRICVPCGRIDAKSVTELVFLRGNLGPLGCREMLEGKWNQYVFFFTHHGEGTFNGLIKVVGNTR